MLHIVDWIIIVFFIISNILLGILLRGRQERAEDFFVAKAALPGVIGNAVVGLSMAATFFSGISFLMYPSLVLSHGLVVYLCMFNMLLYYFIVTKFFVPRFCAENWETPYEILEKRFGKATRKLTGLLYVFMRLGWMAALIYAPTVAILGASGTDQQYFWPLILAVGLGSTLYASLGGLRGIMITDAVQMLIIMLGVTITVLYILFNLPVPFTEAWQKLAETGRLKVFDFSLNPSGGISSWSVIIGTFFASMGLYFGDQMALQRYMTADSIRDVKRSFKINIVGVIIILMLLAGVGLSLAAWYAFHPQIVLPGNSDQIFPFFIASELPPGVGGLVMAALLAATMSSMTSGVNALSSAAQTDLAPEFFTKLSEKGRLKAARYLSFVAGIIATFAAGYVSRLGQIFDITQKLLGLFLGPIAVCFIAAILKIKVREKYMITGLLTGIFGGGLIALSPELAKSWSGFPVIHALWTGPISMLAALVPVSIGIFHSHALSKK